MKRLKKVFRTAALVFTILLAASGAGILGAMMPNNMRHKYQDNIVRIEMVDERREDKEEPELKDQE